MMNQAVSASVSINQRCPLCSVPHIGRVSGTAAREAGRQDERNPIYVRAY